MSSQPLPDPPCAHGLTGGRGAAERCLECGASVTAASPDERLREAAERLTRAVEVLDLSDRRLDDADPYDTLTVPQSASAWRDIRRAVADACAALAAADREAHLEPAPQNDATRAQIVAAKLIADREAPDEETR